MSPDAFAGARGPWDGARIREFFDEAVIPLRLAAVARSGWPVVLSLWFAVEDDRILCATQRDAAIVRVLEHDPRCAFETAGERPPYRGVGGRGRVSLDTGSAGRVLELLLRRYQGGTDGELARWLLSRVETEVAIVIEPVSLRTWDFTTRMGAA